MRTRVLHVITGLWPGGAETLLVRLLDQLGPRREGHRVVSLRPRWPLADRIEEMGVPVAALGIGDVPSPRDIRRLARAIREPRPEVVQTWMLHSNVLVGPIGRAVTRAPVVWGVHLSEASSATLGRKAALVQRFEGALSWVVPARIIACSISSERVMERMRYRRKRIVTIPNGFDVARFKPDPAARLEVRRELGVSDSTPVVGHVARFHPVKDHATLLAAAAEVAAAMPDVRFVLCGYKVEASNQALAAIAEPLGDRVLLLGEREDVPHLLAGFDVAVSSSAGEALPLAVGEAMATGLPVAATDTGDSAELIGDVGEIVPVGNPSALAAAIGRLIEAGPARREELGRRARERITSRYPLERMVEGYEAVWAEVAGDR